jgi:hypothetical protein
MLMIFFKFYKFKVIFYEYLYLIFLKKKLTFKLSSLWFQDLIYHFVAIQFIWLKFFLMYQNLLPLLVFSFINILCSRGNSVYSDYLSDNYYLLHPSMAGAANCSKIRLTARKQWFLRRMPCITNTQL